MGRDGAHPSNVGKFIGPPGFEPTTCRRGDRSTNLASKDRPGSVSYIGLAGFEPATCRLGDRSTDTIYPIRFDRDPF